MLFKHSILIFFWGFFISQSFGQEIVDKDSTSVNKNDPQNQNTSLPSSGTWSEQRRTFDTLEIENKPEIAFGIGLYTFRGDLGNKSANFHPLESSVSWNIKVNYPILSFLDASLDYSGGKFTYNSINNLTSANIETRINTLGINANYNLEHLLHYKKGKFVEPYISVGIEAVEFISKTDKIQNETNTNYHYWNDGSIRDLPQDSPNSLDAKIIQRDYTYESDLRNQQSNTLQYNERTWAIPIGIGFKFHINDQVKFRLFTKYYFTTTDQLDNTSKENAPLFSKGTDKILNTGFSISYNFLKEKEEMLFEDLLQDTISYVSDTLDEDKDLVNDLMDNCPFTKLGVQVDSLGCPFDQDKDGIPDLEDEEILKPIPIGIAQVRSLYCNVLDC